MTCTDTDTDPDSDSDPDYEPSEDCYKSDTSAASSLYDRAPSSTQSHPPSSTQSHPPSPSTLQIPPPLVHTKPLHTSKCRAKKEISATILLRREKFAKDEIEFLLSLDETTRNQLIEAHRALQVQIDLRAGSMPVRFRILSSPMKTETKMLVLEKYNCLLRMSDENGEFQKLRNWLETVCRVPLGKLTPLPVTNEDGNAAIAQFLQKTRAHLDNVIYGHVTAKEQILLIMAQWMSKPGSRGYAIGIHGDKGVGKTSLVKDGIAKALGLPFGFISLGGASDGSFLEGHSYTYEGSTYGKISEVVIKANCMNPVIFFDELDKVSATKKGDEINNILMHLTDSSQNEHFNDRYFGEVDLDLSRALLIFSYNDESLINPILKDRMVTIHASGYQMKDKLTIAQKHLLPNILKEYGLQHGCLVFSDPILEAIISRIPSETGVRNLKRALERLVGWVNMLQYIPDATPSFTISFPFTITESFVHKFLPHIADSSTIHHSSMYT